MRNKIFISSEYKIKFVFNLHVGSGSMRDLPFEKIDFLTQLVLYLLWQTASISLLTASALTMIVGEKNDPLSHCGLNRPPTSYLHVPSLPDPYTCRKQSGLCARTSRFSPTRLCVLSFSYVSPSFVYIPVVHAMYLWLFTWVSLCIHLSSSIISSSHLNSRCGSPGEMNCQLLKTSSG